MLHKTALLTAILTLVAGGALAQNAPPAATPAPAPTATAAAAAAARPNVDSTIEAIATNPETKPILEKYIPEIPVHPAYDQFKGMTLRQLAPLSGGLITEAKITSIDNDIKALPGH